jgi:hypothetical protein
MATAARPCGVPKKAGSRSPEFRAALIEARKGRSYREFAIALETKSGLAFNYSTLKKVEAGTRSPSAHLIYALELMAGRTPSPLLGVYVHGSAPKTGASAESDLSRHGRTELSPLPTGGGVDGTTAARIRELEGRIEELQVYESIVNHLRPLLADALAAVGAEGHPVARTASKGRRRH